MGRSRSAAAGFPPAGLPGLDPSFSRHVRVTGADGTEQTFHVLDTGETPDAAAAGTLLCLHGNPTWSYLWRRLLIAAPPGWRVVAPDQLGMGYSERLTRSRTLIERVADLDRLSAALGLTGPGTAGPIVVVAHDWGGIICMGWALRHTARIAGLVLTNTAVHQPGEVAGPALIRLARLPGVRPLVCRWTPTFVRAATALSRPALNAPVRAAFAAPYRTPARRAAVADFVADIPFADHHPSRPALDEIARGLTGWDVPTLILWGARDPVFGSAHLQDLTRRLPRAVVHRFERAGHLLAEDAPEYADLIGNWLAGVTGPAVGQHTNAAGGLHTTAAGGLHTGVAADRHIGGPDADAAAAHSVDTRSAAARPPADSPAARPARSVVSAPSLFAALDRRAADASPAVVEVGRGAISWAELAGRIDRAADRLVEAGLGPGQRVALLVPPSVELTVALYAVWRAHGAVVIADRGLGLPGLARALRGAHVDAVIATTPGLLAARALRIPGRRIAAAPVSALVRRLAGVRAELSSPPATGSTIGSAATEPPGTGPAADLSRTGEPGPDAEAAVLFTSGATGPAKGVRYRHDQLRAQVQLIADTYQITRDDRIVAAFAPFALYGPALGIASVVPDADVTRPASLTATALADAVAAVDATVVFASPAALRNVLATADALTGAHRRALAGVRLVMSAGAPVPAALLRALLPLLPTAELHTPYGMTEALPVTDIDLPGIEAAGAGDGVCVGRPLTGVAVALTPIDDPAAPLSDRPDRTGEIWVSAAHVKDSYDQLWATDQAAAAHPGWHRTGDVGALDPAGRLWIQGRVAHLIRTAAGPLPPVGIERRVQDGLAAAGHRLSETDVAAVGVGPAGTAQVVVVLAGVRADPGPVLAGPEFAGPVRAAAGVPVAAVLRTRSLPVDPRHQSKIDRTELGVWAAGVLAGG